MKKLILKLLELIPFKTSNGLSLADLLKIWYNKRHPKNCFCGGRIICYSFYDITYGDSYEFVCNRCGFLADED